VVHLLEQCQGPRPDKVLHVAWHVEVGNSVRSGVQQRAWIQYRRLLDELALGATWQIGQWRMTGPEPTFDMSAHTPPPFGRPLEAARAAVFCILG
jgi:hypothetical protein